MPTKHIPDATWRKVEKEMVRAVVATQMPIKESQVLNLLILKGIEAVKDSDYKALKKK